MVAQNVQRSFEQSFGTACFVAYLAILLFRHTEKLISHFIAQTAVMGILFVAGFALCAFLADKLDNMGPARISIFASALCAAGSALLEVRHTLPISILGGLLALAGCMAFLFIFGKNLAFYNHSERICFIAAAFLAGAAIVAISAALADAAVFTLLILLPVLAALHLCTLKPNKDTFSFSNLEITRKSHRFSLTALFTTAITGFVWGIAFCLMAKPFKPEISIPLCFALPLVMGSLVCLIDANAENKLSENFLLRCFATAAFIGIAPLPFVPEWAQQLCGAVLFLAFSADTIVCFSAMGEVARFNQISPYWVFGISFAHYFAGALTGYLAFGWGFSQGTLEGQLILCFATLLAVIWCGNFVFQNNYPCSESIADLMEAGKSLSKNESKPALWQYKIGRVIEEFELTARQQEVFRMLVRGRNAQYIAEKFFISNSTAKAHIHNIYQKLDIHSQQELINLVEDVEIPEDFRPVDSNDFRQTGE